MQRNINRLFVVLACISLFAPGVVIAGAIPKIQVQTTQLVSKMGVKMTHQFMSLSSCGGYVFSVWRDKQHDERFIVERSDKRSSKILEYNAAKGQLFSPPRVLCVNDKALLSPQALLSERKYFLITASMKLAALKATSEGSLPGIYNKMPLELMKSIYGFRQIPGVVTRFSLGTQGSSKVYFQNTAGKIETMSPPWFKDIRTSYPEGDLVSLTFYKHPQGARVQEIIDDPDTGILPQDALKRKVEYYREVGGAYERMDAENLSCEEKMFVLIDWITDANGIVAKLVNHSQNEDPHCGGTTRAGKKVLIHRLSTGIEEAVGGASFYDSQFISTTQIDVDFATKKNGQTMLWRSSIDLQER